MAEAVRNRVQHKEQGVSVERGFRFLKDPLFFAHNFFLKSPQRIMALLMVMGLALLIYALAERKLRQAKKNWTEPQDADAQLLENP